MEQLIGVAIYMLALCLGGAAITWAGKLLPFIESLSTTGFSAEEIRFSY